MEPSLNAGGLVEQRFSNVIMARQSQSQIALSQDREGRFGIRHRVPKRGESVDLDQSRGWRFVGVSMENVASRDERYVIEGDDRCALGNRREILPQPLQLSVVDVPVVPEISDVDACPGRRSGCRRR